PAPSPAGGPPCGPPSQWAAAHLRLQRPHAQARACPRHLGGDVHDGDAYPRQHVPTRLVLTGDAGGTLTQRCPTAAVRATGQPMPASFAVALTSISTPSRSASARV